MSLKPFRSGRSRSRRRKNKAEPESSNPGSYEQDMDLESLLDMLKLSHLLPYFVDQERMHCRFKSSKFRINI